MRRQTIKNWMKALYWTPRVLCIIYILFLSMFAFDVFGEYGFPEVLVALFMHLVPSLILVGLLIVAWKWEKIGGIVFLVMAVGFTLFFNRNMELMGFIILSCPLLLVGALFLAHDHMSK
ncbi:hypothetical protein ACFL96_14240 [Thermoproteota archaeon]